MLTGVGATLQVNSWDFNLDFNLFIYCFLELEEHYIVVNYLVVNFVQ